MPTDANAAELTSAEPINVSMSRTAIAAGMIIPFPEERGLPHKAARRRRHPYLLSVLLVLMAVGVGCVFEARTSTLQSWLFVRWSSKLHYATAPGPSDSIALPSTGPFDERSGYTRIADFSLRLQANGFRITEQARQTPALADLIRSGISPRPIGNASSPDSPYATVSAFSSTIPQAPTLTCSSASTRFRRSWFRRSCSSRIAALEMSPLRERIPRSTGCAQVRPWCCTAGAASASPFRSRGAAHWLLSCRSFAIWQKVARARPLKSYTR